MASHKTALSICSLRPADNTTERKATNKNVVGWEAGGNSLILEFEVLKTGLSHKTPMRDWQWAKEAYLKVYWQELQSTSEAARNKLVWEAKL